jgi:hypothetical protein
LQGLYHPDDAKTLRIHVRREIAQDCIGIVSIIIEESGEVASGIERHGSDQRLQDICLTIVTPITIHPKATIKDRTTMRELGRAPA